MTPTPDPLRDDELAQLRSWLAEPGAHTMGRGVAALEVMPRLLATLDAALAAQPAPPLEECGALRDIVVHVPVTAERLQFVHPNVREDAYNQGVRDLAVALAREYAALSEPKS